MSIRSVWLAGLFILGACAANAQTTPVYWSTDPKLDCTGYGDANGKPAQLTSGPGTGGYVCHVWGTLPYYSTGQGWSSSIRVSAPSSAAVNYSFFFNDENGAGAVLDYRFLGESTIYSDASAIRALYANDPLELDILGLSSAAPGYGVNAAGPVSVYVECPDADTCSQAQAQLIYSFLPYQPWSLSVPVVWDWQTWLAWSVVGIDDSLTNGDPNTKNTVSFVIYNLDTVKEVSHTYTINVFDALGNKLSTVTDPVPPYGSYAKLLSDLFPNLPSGPFKLQVVSTSTDAYVAFEALQFHGPSATALVSAWENVPAVAASAASTNDRKARHPAPEALRKPRSHSSAAQ